MSATTTMTKLIQLISTAMENAVENGYENNPDNNELASDLQICDADIENYSFEEILEALEIIRPSK